jgi:putative endonuclease
MGMSRLSPQDLGRWGEEIARLFMEAQGFVPLARRYRKRSGEIDWIMQRGLLVVFVEVKARCTTDHGRPEEAVTWRKLGRLRQLARCFLQEHPPADAVDIRFDVVAIELLGEGRGCHLRHYAGIG